MLDSLHIASEKLGKNATMGDDVPLMKLFYKNGDYELTLSFKKFRSLMCLGCGPISSQGLNKIIKEVKTRQVLLKEINCFDVSRRRGHNATGKDKFYI